jgi:5S rRNA maturation endonuclease (ribonuclease M5)
VRIIKGKFNDIVVMLDPDSAGRKAEKKIMRIFNA